MTGFLEFEYETNDGQLIEIQGEVDSELVKFRAYKNNKNFNKTNLSSLDVQNIEEYILHNAKTEIEDIYG